MYIICALSLGSVATWFGKLNSDYVHLILGLGVLVWGHSVKEDYFKSN
jgi:hypothetical protein